MPTPGTTIRTYKAFLDVKEKGILTLSQFAKATYLISTPCYLHFPVSNLGKLSVYITYSLRLLIKKGTQILHDAVYLIKVLFTTPDYGPEKKANYQHKS